MTIPDYQQVMLPLLEFLADEKEHSLRNCTNSLAEVFKLSEEEKRKLLPSGQQEIFHNRVGWAKFYLEKAGLVQTVRRGVYKITSTGRKVLNDDPETVDNKFLEQFPSFVEFMKNSSQSSNDKTEEKSKQLQEDTATPEESFEYAYQKLRKELANELLETIKSCSPEFFEKLVVDLLISMGYGGSRKDAGEAIGKTNDEGIDGIIKEDRLGLDTIYIQAKRWQSCVGRPEIQKFAGALQGQRAKKGIFITTSYYSKEAEEFVKNIDSKIILLDGLKLAEYMIDFNVGVSRVSSYEIKKIDSDYFVEG